MRGDLFFEIGTEEIPAGFLARALAELPALARARLGAARLEHDDVVALGAPRRLALHVKNLVDRQADIAETVTGPPASAAFDKAGKPTRAALGFAQKTGVPVEELKVVEVPGKGAYVTAARAEQGAETRLLLPNLLVDLARAIPWKKSMRWAGLDEAFVRPVHWLVALYAGEIVPLTMYGVTSGGATRGHRFLAPAAIDLDGSLDDYRGKLRRAFVVVDPADRKTAVLAELARVQKESGAHVRPDAELLDEVTNLVEYPQAVVGSFAESFLAIPPEVIISAMRGHQRYFATEVATAAATEGAQATKLGNRFVTVAGTLTRDPEVVRHGNERVLAARLADAQFFWDEDRARSADAFAQRLGGLVFQKALGTVADKVERVAALGPLFPVDAAAFAQAARLAKLDLVSKMVGEFPDLQGVMGRYYAPAWGAAPEVAEAILEHYLPRGATDRLPPSPLGAALAIADRVDTIVGCWAVGLAPTGSADAFGLRRAALAVLNILAERGWTLPLSQLVAAAAALQKVQVAPAAPAEILEFMKTRLRGLLVATDGKSLAADCVDAALAVGSDDVPDAVARALAVAHLRDRPDFEPLGVAFKRVANIIKGGSSDVLTAMPAGAHPSEQALWDRYRAVAGTVEQHVAAREYDLALRELAGLKPAVDKFFDDVLVMDEDPAVRKRRLDLLGTLNRTFLRIADFKQLAVR